MKNKILVGLGVFLFAGILTMATTWTNQGSDLAGGEFNDTEWNLN